MCKNLDSAYILLINDELLIRTSTRELVWYSSRTRVANDSVGTALLFYFAALPVTGAAIGLTSSSLLLKSTPKHGSQFQVD